MNVSQGASLRVKLIQVRGYFADQQDQTDIIRWEYQHCFIYLKSFEIVNYIGHPIPKALFSHIMKCETHCDLAAFR